MFERYTEQARSVVVVAQEEARDLCHNYVGTEHLLLALQRLPRDSVVGQVLAGLGLTVDGVRERLKELVPAGQDPTAGPMPFTPRSKRTLETSLREALSRGDNNIGPEHILLAIARADEGSVAMRLLQAHEIAPDQLRTAVLDALQSPRPPAGDVVRDKPIRRMMRRGMPSPTPIAVDYSGAAWRLVLSAAARALDDGRVRIDVADIEEALRRHRDADDAPPQSATG